MIAFLIIMGLWFMAGFIVATLIGVSWIRAFQVGLLVLIGALVWVATYILPDAYRKRIFFEGPKPDEEGLFIVGCFNAFPLAILLLAGLFRLVLKIVELFQ